MHDLSKITINKSKNNKKQENKTNLKNNKLALLNLISIPGMSIVLKLL
jgi:hypothetical protein